MLCFLFVLMATSIFVGANPIPDELADSIDLNSNTVTFIPDADVGAGNTITSSVSSPIAATETDPHCDTHASVDEDTENNLQKRLKYCPEYPNPKIPKIQSSTTGENNPCRGTKLPHYLSCGGPEVIYPDGELEVWNCVPGRFSGCCSL